MSKILAVGSPKGGVGKTTAAVTLAALAARVLSLRVLLVDADANQSAMEWAGRATDDSMPFEVASGTEDDTGADPDGSPHRELTPDQLAAALAQLRRGRRHDLTVVDLPGAREGAFKSMLRGGGGGRPVADFLLVPVRPELMDLRPVVRVVQTEVVPLRLPYLVALTMVDTVSMVRARGRQAELTGDEGLAVADTIIRDYAIYDEALETNRTVLDIGGRHSYARTAETEYRALGVEVFGAMGFDVTPLQEVS